VIIFHVPLLELFEFAPITSAKDMVYVYINGIGRKPPGVLCTRFKSIKNVEPIGNNEVVGI
jgi:hypothetical protein